MHRQEKRRRSESPDLHSPVPASSASELPTPDLHSPVPASTASELPTLDRSAKAFSCRQNSAPDSRCTYCANPTCPFPRGKISPGRDAPKFSKSLCAACNIHFLRHGVMRNQPTAATAQSRYDAECRQNNPPDSRCTSGCCSDCANITCPLPRGVLRAHRGLLKLFFVKHQGKIVCEMCASFFRTNATWRSEALLAASRELKKDQILQLCAANSAEARLKGRLKHKLQEEIDKDYGPNTTGESGKCVC